MMSEVLQVTVTEEKLKTTTITADEDNKPADKASEQEQQGRAMVIAPLADVAGASERVHCASTSKDLLAGLLSNLVDGEQPAQQEDLEMNMNDAIDGEETPLTITDLDATTAETNATSGAQDNDYSPLTPPDSQQGLFYYTPDAEYGVTVAYYTTVDGFFPVDGNVAPWYSLQQNTDDGGGGVNMSGDYWSHGQPQAPVGYGWTLAQQDCPVGVHVAVKEEPYDESSLVQAAANFEHCYAQQQVKIKSAEDSAEAGGAEQAEVNYDEQEESALGEDQHHRHHQDLAPVLPVDEQTLVELAAKYTHQRFPIKLWNLANDVDFEPITWSADGTSLIIDEFALEPTLRHFFRSHKFSSFLRQLHLYGFRKMTRMRSHKGDQERLRTDYISEYGAKDFIRGRFDLVKNVRRFYGTSSSEKTLSPKTPSLTPPAVPQYMASSPQPSSSSAGPYLAMHSQPSLDSYRTESTSYSIASTLEHSSAMHHPYLLFKTDPNFGGGDASLPSYVPQPYIGHYHMALEQQPQQPQIEEVQDKSSSPDEVAQLSTKESQ